MADEKIIGLTTNEALGQLHKDVEELLNCYIKKMPDKYLRWTSTALHNNNPHSLFSWISLFHTLLIGISFFLAQYFHWDTVTIYGFFAGTGCIVMLFGILNICLVCWDKRLRDIEMIRRIKTLLTFVKECQWKCNWRSEHYPHLYLPYSPCITLQWTYRDNVLVNLPWALLCKGDVIVMRPGQTAPGNLQPLDEHQKRMFMKYGDVYIPPQKHDDMTAPTARKPYKNEKFVLSETPLLRNIDEILHAYETRNVITTYDKQLFLITVKVLRNLAVPILILCSVLLGLLKTIYIGEWVENPHWTFTFLVVPSCIVLPIVPLSFPSAWIALNTLGNAKLSAFLQSTSTTKTADPFEDVSIEDDKVDIGSGVKWGQHFVHALFGSQHSLALIRSASPLHILSSITTFCCVDKKGILSWPNPTAHEIFFLKTAPKPNLTRDTTVEDNLSDIEPEGVINTVERGGEQGPGREVPGLSTNEQDLCTTMEVLGVNYDIENPMKLQFSDPQWAQHLGSLKPIGLAILLNTCNMETHEHYVRFSSHVTCEAMYNKDLVPVINRRCPHWVEEVTNILQIQKCLCEVSKEIGFTDGAKQSFALLEQLCTFRHVQPETVRRDIKFARSLAIATKLKLPFPHMVSVVTRERAIPTSLQLFSQATGDVALESCIDFWDGTALRILSPQDRKMIHEYYRKSSLTDYCTAFSYRPLGRPVNSDLSKVYMELPADSSSLYVRNQSPTPLSNCLRQSTDSLLMSELTEEVNDMDGCFDMQCNQIFLGMVTMQYRVKVEMAQLIEQLERSCIRFVHFSKENEVRSLSFSQKMGLESGWNCHISLLSSEQTTKEENVEQDEKEEEWEKSQDPCTPLLGTNSNLKICFDLLKPLSQSAPCGINTDSTRDNPEESRSRDDELEVQSLQEESTGSLFSESTTQSNPINFDMSNRAKLPRGIEQIRPHIDRVDNVPLLVSTFTDCTPSTTKEMIKIMKDYDKIVCVIGSSANADNSSIFLKANASLSLEPLYPQVCQEVPVFTPVGDSISPVQLSARFNSLPCSVSITSQRPVSIIQLIMNARHYMFSLWNCIQFWMCCVATVCLTQLITIMCMLPPLFSSGQVLWISALIIPLLSVSLVHSPANSQVMQKPTVIKQSTLNCELVIFVLWCYGSKFLITIFLIPLIYGITLVSYCSDIAATYSSSCMMVYPVPNEPLGGWVMNEHPLATAQYLSSTGLIMHLVIVSIGFVHRDFLCWRKNPMTNAVWWKTAMTILSFQLIFFFGVTINTSHHFPWISFLLVIMSSILIFVVHEFVKWQEIKANLRYEKRARLDFTTKLGMNSPF